MKKVLFIDRDGTIILEPEDEQIDSLEKLEFYPKAIVNLHKIAGELDYELVMVTNQDGLGTDSFPEDTFWPAHNKMMDLLKNEGVNFSDVLMDRSFPKDNSPNRKPATGMLGKYIHGDYNLEQSFVIGDRETDIMLAKNLGSKSIFLSDKPNEAADLTTTDWEAVYNFLKDESRIAKVERSTKETKISVAVNLDGSGKSDIDSGIGFFDHMLEQIARHSGCDLTINVKGDLEVDEHHTIEDTALALGEAFREALGSKKGIERYGFLLPMDDSLVQVAIDFSGRSWLVWKAKFKREKVGDVPTEMFNHFFKSFCDTAGCNLNVKAIGDNEHHKIEAIFKAFGKSIKQAVSKTGKGEIPSTKGTL
jgi:imidazoleglycerol-phosphate dehydratase/histidinol-phosphatase